MRLQNTIPIFIFTLIASTYLYFIASMAASQTTSIVAGITFIISLAGLITASIKIKTYTYIYYLLLSIYAIILIIYYILIGRPEALFLHYFFLATLIALLLSLTDMKKILTKNPKRYLEKVAELEKEAYKTKIMLEQEKEETRKKNQEIALLKEQGERIRKELDKARKESNENKRKTEEQNKTIQNLKNRNKSLTDKAKHMDELEKEKNKLEKQLKGTQTEIKKQETLKAKYSKTLGNIKRKRKEEEELLIVSSDGKSVHRPKCIAVRNVPKENRKLIKNWEIAKKEDYTGCKLCNPHIKPKIIIRQGKKYGYIGSKTSDKAHKASCVLTKNIAEKDRNYFKTYKEALKKKYTACRVCNPYQYRN